MSYTLFLLVDVIPMLVSGDPSTVLAELDMVLTQQQYLSLYTPQSSPSISGYVPIESPLHRAPTRDTGPRFRKHATLLIL